MITGQTRIWFVSGPNVYPQWALSEAHVKYLKQTYEEIYATRWYFHELTTALIDQVLYRLVDCMASPGSYPLSNERLNNRYKQMGIWLINRQEELITNEDMGNSIQKS